MLQILFNWLLANYIYIAAVLGAWHLLKIAYTKSNDPKLNSLADGWKVWRRQKFIFVAELAFMVVVVGGVINWIVPAIATRINSSPIAIGGAQVLANTIAAVQGLTNPNLGVAAAGNNGLVGAMQPVAVPASNGGVQDLTSVLSGAASSVLGGVDALVASPQQPAVVAAPVVTQPVVVQPAVTTGNFAAVAAPVVPVAPVVVQGPQRAPAGWLPPEQQGPRIEAQPTAAPANPWNNLSQELFGAKKEGGGPTVHIVVRGDTMGKIAKAYGVPVNQLCKLNYETVHRNCNLLRSGMELMIPVN